MKVKLGVLFLVAVMASASIGVSYAYSFGEDHFKPQCDGQYDTCKMRIYPICTMDPGPNYLQPRGSLIPQCSPWDGTSDPQYGLGCNDEGKNVASTRFERRLCYSPGYKTYDIDYPITNDGYQKLSSKCNPLCTPSHHKVKINMNNVYPWYSSGFTVCMWNSNSWWSQCGAASVNNVIFEWTAGAQMQHFFKIHDWSIFIPCGGYYRYDEGQSGNPYDQLVATLKDEVILYPWRPLFLTVYFHFEEDAYIDDNGVLEVMPQDTAASFDWSFTWAQVDACCTGSCQHP